MSGLVLLPQGCSCLESHSLSLLLQVTSNGLQPISYTFDLTTNLSNALSTAALTAPVNSLGSPAAQAGCAGLNSPWLPSTRPTDPSRAVLDSCRNADRLLMALVGSLCCCNPASGREVCGTKVRCDQSTVCTRCCA
jgi:hypothetical protein